MPWWTVAIHRGVERLLGVSVVVLFEMKAQALVSQRPHVTTMDRYDVAMNRELVVFLPFFTPPFRWFERIFVF